jgi:hypothetical protein
MIVNEKKKYSPCWLYKVAVQSCRNAIPKSHAFPYVKYKRRAMRVVGLLLQKIVAGWKKELNPED